MPAGAPVVAECAGDGHPTGFGNGHRRGAITSTGRGSDVMAPLALPIVGGMAIEVITLFVVPTLHCAGAERRLG